MAALLGGRGDRLRWAIIAATWLLVIVGLQFAPLQVEWDSFVPSVRIAIVFVVIGIVYRTWRPDEKIASTVTAMAQILLFTLGSALVNYLCADFGRPLYDAELAAADRALGFDWHGYVAAIHAWPFFEAALKLAYESALAQVATVVVILGLTGRRARLDRFALAFMLAVIGTVAIWTVFPTFGAFHYFHVTGQFVPLEGITFTTTYADTLSRIHAGGPQTLGLGQVVGLVGFPSFHTVMAILCAQALWRVRFVGPLAIVLNAMVLLAVPGDGGHHLVDLLGGVVMTALAYWLAVRLLNSGSQRLEVPGMVVPSLSGLRT